MSPYEPWLGPLWVFWGLFLITLSPTILISPPLLKKFSQTLPNVWLCFHQLLDGAPLMIANNPVSLRSNFYFCSCWCVLSCFDFQNRDFLHSPGGPRPTSVEQADYSTWTHDHEFHDSEIQMSLHSECWVQGCLPPSPGSTHFGSFNLTIWNSYNWLYE